MARENFVRRPPPAEAPPNSDNIQDDAQQHHDVQRAIAQRLAQLQAFEHAVGQGRRARATRPKPEKWNVRQGGVQRSRNRKLRSVHRRVHHPGRGQRLGALPFWRPSEIEPPPSGALKERQPDDVKTFRQVDRLLFEDRAVVPSVVYDSPSIDLQPRAIIREQLKDIGAGTIHTNVTGPPR